MNEDPMRFTLFFFTVIATTSCTYGPMEENAEVVHVTRLGDSYQAVAIVQHSRFQRPTGLSTFPDGGKIRFLERRASQFLLDSRMGNALRLASQEAPDSLWESFAAYVAGVEGDSATYVRLTGCPRGGECHPDIQKEAIFRLTVSGHVRGVRRVPSNAALPGTSLSRGPGEKNYVRFSTSGDTITVRFEEDGSYRPMFLVRADGTVTTIGG